MRLPTVVASLVPDLGHISVAERLRASVGALLGLFLTGLLSRLALGSTGSLPLLIAPMGASAVLLFAVPSSPLAQPWSILGGNVVSALIGVTAARFIPEPTLAAAVGGACAIGSMMVLRCLHPPSGAVALTAVLGGPAIRDAGYHFVIWPVGLNSIVLLAVALAFNNATGRRYPHRPARQQAAITEAAVASVLRRHDELVDVGRHDLASLVGEVEAETLHASEDPVRCSGVMRPEADMLAASMPLDDALDRLVGLGRNALPVVDAMGRCVGLVTQADLVRHLRPTRIGCQAVRLLRRSLQFDVAPASVGAAAKHVEVAVEPDTPLIAVLDRMLETGIDYCPVLGQERKIVGAVLQADVLRWLLAQGRPDRVASAQPRSAIQRL